MKDSNATQISPAAQTPQLPITWPPELESSSPPELEELPPVEAIPVSVASPVLVPIAEVAPGPVLPSPVSVAEPEPEVPGVTVSPAVVGAAVVAIEVPLEPPSPVSVEVASSPQPAVSVTAQRSPKPSLQCDMIGRCSSIRQGRESNRVAARPSVRMRELFLAPLVAIACGGTAATSSPAPVPAATATPPTEDVRADAPAPAATPEPAAEPPPPKPETPAAPDEPYPTAYCGFPNDVVDRWEIPLDLRTKDDLRRAVRLLDRYPDADGHRRALARTNLPDPYQAIDRVHVLAAGNPPVAAKVQRAGVRSSPADARFILVLDTRPKDLRGAFALVVDTEDAPAGMQPVARDGSDATLSPEGPVDLRRFMRHELDRDGVDADRSARFEAVGRVDLDGDGLHEVVVHEHWPEGLFVWLVRWDAAAGALTGTFVCGDAS